MSIPSAKYLKVKSAKRLSTGREPKKVVLAYAGIIALSSLVVNTVKYLLDSRISQTGGLQNISARSMLSTAGTAVTILQMLLVMCLGVGYAAAMLRIVRGQYASPATLKAGAERLWLLLRSRLAQLIVYFSVSFGVCLLAANLYLFTPLSNGLMETLASMTLTGEITPEQLLSDPALLSSIYGSMLPLMIAYVLLLIPVMWYLSCTYRMTDYLIIDQPQLGAIGVLRQSRKMMKGNRKMMLRLDLSFWWYYLLQALVSALVYLDVILALLGVHLSLSEGAWFFLVVLVYLAADFALRYFCNNRVTAAYAQFYDLLAPRQEENGTVLGNIFQM